MEMMIGERVYMTRVAHALVRRGHEQLPDAATIAGVMREINDHDAALAYAIRDGSVAGYAGERAQLDAIATAIYEQVRGEERCSDCGELYGDGEAHAVCGGARGHAVQILPQADGRGYVYSCACGSRSGGNLVGRSLSSATNGGHAHLKRAIAAQARKADAATEARPAGPIIAGGAPEPWETGPLVDDAAYLVALERRAVAAEGAAVRKRADVNAYSHATPDRRTVLREVRHGSPTRAALLNARSVVHERTRARNAQADADEPLTLLERLADARDAYGAHLLTCMTCCDDAGGVTPHCGHGATLTATVAEIKFEAYGTRREA